MHETQTIASVNGQTAPSRFAAQAGLVAVVAILVSCFALLAGV